MKAIVIGATSGIGRSLSKILSQNNYEGGICGRRKNLLDSLEKELSRTCYKSVMDLQKLEEAQELFQDLLLKILHFMRIVEYPS